MEVAVGRMHRIVRDIHAYTDHKNAQKHIAWRMEVCGRILLNGTYSNGV
jgi:hypothetical protein